MLVLPIPLHPAEMREGRMTARSQYLQESTVKYSATAPALLKDVSLDCDPRVISQLAGADGSAWEPECRKTTQKRAGHPACSERTRLSEHQEHLMSPCTQAP